jgi:DNA-binding response OmpR family regulator
MPRMDDMKVLQQIKATPPLQSLPVIMQTAMGGVAEIMAGLNVGAFYYLTKPLNHKLVMAVVRTAVEDHAREIVLSITMAVAFCWPRPKPSTRSPTKGTVITSSWKSGSEVLA